MPGWDVDTAPVDKLLLALSIRYGQIMQNGIIACSGTSTSMSGSAAIGPFNAVPDVMAWWIDVSSQLHIYPTNGRTVGTPLIQALWTGDIAVFSTAISCSVSMQGTFISGEGAGSQMSYCCYRKPLNG